MSQYRTIKATPEALKELIPLSYLTIRRRFQLYQWRKKDPMALPATKNGHFYFFNRDELLEAFTRGPGG